MICNCFQRRWLPGSRLFRDKFSPILCLSHSCLWSGNVYHRKFCGLPIGIGSPSVIGWQCSILYPYKYIQRAHLKLCPYEAVINMLSEKIKIAIDRGGTFTDCIGSYKGKEEIVKLLSVDPSNYDDAPLEGIRRLLERFTGKTIAREDKLDTSLIGMLSDVRLLI